MMQGRKQKLNVHSAQFILAFQGGAAGIGLM